MDNKNENNKPNKRKASNKRRNNSSSEGKENTPKIKKLKTNKRSSTEGIAVSKQLAIRKQKTQVRKRKSNNEPKRYPNGKPMPSLADLEKMYEDSDTEEQASPKTETPKSPTKETKTADKFKLLSPSTVSKIAERMMAIIENTEPTELFAQINIPIPPVIPIKKTKKSDIPYIVGCKDRPKVVSKPTTSFCKGDDDYGVNSKTNQSVEEDQIPNKRRKKSKIGGFSKSIFNAHSDEIAEQLKTFGDVDRSWDISKTEQYGFQPYMPSNLVAEQPQSTAHDSDESRNSSNTVEYDFNAKFTVNEDSKRHVTSENDIHNDASQQSNKTEEYDFNASLTANCKPVTFSPLPSTSRDNETFIKNDNLLNESLSIHDTVHKTAEKGNDKTLIKNSKHSNKSLTLNCTMNETAEDQNNTDVQIIEIPCETIIINDEINNQSFVEETKLNKPAEIIEPIKTIPDNLDDDDCVILIDESNVKSKRESYDNLTTIVIDDEYSTINIDDSYKGDVGDEIIDIDSLIEENKAIIDKIQETKRFDSVIEVVEIPNSPSPGIQQIEPENTSAIYENTSHYSEPTNICNSPNNQTNILSSTNPGGTGDGQNSEDTAHGANISTDNSSRPVNSSTPMLSRNTIGDVVADFFRTSQLLVSSNNVFTRIDNLIHTLDCIIPNNGPPTFRQHTEILVGNRSDLSHEEDSDSSNPQPYRTSRANANVVNKQKKKKKTSNKSEAQVASENLSAGTDSAEKGTRNFGDCPICMDSLSNNIIASTICGHVFCLACIQAAVRSSGKRCPTCRKVLKGAGYHQLYL